MKSKLFVIMMMIAVTLFGKNYKKEFDKILKENFNAGTPSISVAVISHGKIIYKNAFGMASLELNVPATTQSVYRIGSLSKQITAAAVLMLAQDGKLNVEDRLVQYFPELPTAVYGEVTLEQMIYHTSGIRDSENMYALMGIEFAQWYTHDMLLEMLQRQKGLCFEPGSEYEYSNSAYTLLALIVEKVSGQKFSDFITQHIFNPLGMSHTIIQDTCSTFIPNRTAGYKLSDGKFDNWMTNNQLVGHDAVYSSVEDLFLWQQAIEKGQIGKYDLQSMKIPGYFNDGTAGKYGYGLVMGKYRGLNSFCHDGWYVGYKAFIITFPEQEFAVIAFSNLGNRSPRPYAFKIIDLYLKDFFDMNVCQSITASDQFVEINGTEKFVRLKLGSFKSLESIKNGYFISPWDDNEFCTADQLTRLQIAGEGTALQLRQTTSYGSRHIFVPFEEIVLSDAEKTGFCGNYYSTELDIEAEVYVKDNTLRIKVGLTDEVFLQFAPDQFAADEALAAFNRNQDGIITGFIFSTYSVRGIEFLAK